MPGPLRGKGNRQEPLIEASPTACKRRPELGRRGVILPFVRRPLVAFLLLAAAGALAATGYWAYARDRDYTRLIAAGDQAAADQPFEALEAYSGAIALRPESMLAHLKRGRMYRERGELEAAARDLRRAIALDPTATLPLELLGDTYLSMARNDRAAERYEDYLSLDDRTPRVWYKLGLARYRNGEAAAAIPALERAIALDSSLADSHFVLGLCHREQGDLPGARAALEIVTQLSPGLTAPREALAAVYADSGDNSRAIDQLEALAALDPTTSSRFVALGLAHARARRHEAAVLTLSRAVERFPNDPGVYGALGRVWLDAAETRQDPVALKKALEALATAATHADATSETLTDLGRAFVRSGDLTAAQRFLRQATTRLPVYPGAYLNLAVVSERAGRLQEARDALVNYAVLVDEAVPIAEVATQIAAYSIRLGQPQLAIRWLDRATDETGDTPELAALRRRAADAR
jgi:tetratricopeptide (TPR) repeat protein